MRILFIEAGKYGASKNSKLKQLELEPASLTFSLITQLTMEKTQLGNLTELTVKQSFISQILRTKRTTLFAGKNKT